jgi:hypothetical protein
MGRFGREFNFAGRSHASMAPNCPWGQIEMPSAKLDPDPYFIFARISICRLASQRTFPPLGGPLPWRAATRKRAGHLGPRLGATASGGKGSGASKRAHDGDMCSRWAKRPQRRRVRRVQRGAPCRGGEGMANLKLGIDRCDRRQDQIGQRPKRGPN